MEKENEITTVTQKDLLFIKEELLKINATPSLHELARKLAFHKNAGQLSQKVKKYDPYCRYEIGDLVSKLYAEPLLVSSKGTEDFNGTVVLKVINKIIYDSYNCEMLEVDYTGGGTFRKHIDYMKKTKTQVLLPSSLEGKSSAPETLKQEDDPRFHELPMTEKDLRTLEKNLNTAMSRSDLFFNWSDLWQLSEKQIEIKEEKINEIRVHMVDGKQSETAVDLAVRFLGGDKKKTDFPIFCLSLNHALEKKYKKQFLFVTPQEWGRWALRENLNKLLKNIPLTAEAARLPENVVELRAQFPREQKFPLKTYLTWREILSGGIRVPKNLIRDLSKIREYTFIDVDRKGEHTVYFFPNPGIFLGLGAFFEKNNITQGASLTLEKDEESRIKFWIKKSKKKLSVPKVLYDSKEDRFSRDGEFQTPSLPNKILYLENDAIDRLGEMHEERKDLDLRELLILIFKKFGIEGEALSLHYQRAYHLVDVLKQTNLEDVEHTMLLSPEFERSEKKNALFLYHEKILLEEEIAVPESELETERAKKAGDLERSRKQDDLPAIGTVGEIETPKVILEEKIIEPPKEKPKPEIAAPVIEPPKAPAPPPTRKRTAPAKKKLELVSEKEKTEKEQKKKKHKAKPEVEKGPRRRKGERRIIEERIELEESESEAFFAVKTDEDIVEDVSLDSPEVEPAEFIKPQEPEKPLAGGLFGSMLKDALSQKKSEPKKETDLPEKPKKKKK